MKKLTVLLFTLLFFFSVDAQQILAGIYSGSMYNDSTRMLQKYELALSEHRGKVFGYSYVTFVVNDTFYYGIRRVKGFKNDKNELVLTDEELLANNFPESPAKRVKRTATFPLAQEDTITSLAGTWQTNRTKLYYSVGGATKTERSLDSSQSPLVAHLQELKIISGGPNYQEPAVARKEPKKEKKEDVAKNTVKEGNNNKGVTEPGRNEVAKGHADTKEQQPKEATPTRVPAAHNPAANTTNTSRPEENKATTPAHGAGQNPAAINGKPRPAAASSTETAKENTVYKPAEGTNGSVGDAKKPTGTPAQNSNNKSADKRGTPADKQGATERGAAVAAVAPLEQRSTNVIRTLEVVSDSITLSFYDNGVVDGDVISVFVNGQNVIASARLNEVAMKKTIHLPTFAGDSVQVILVAETLGSIPPNTGLLLVHDGDKRYDIRFSADLNTNASIVFRKAKK